MSWYIIPEEEVLGMENISLHTETNRGSYEEYPEAWHLLEDSPEDGEKIEIQACAEEFFDFRC